jgi:type I restriction enzyme S subunit
MSEGKEHKLSEVAENFAMGPFGSNIKAENFQESGVPVIRGTNLNFYKYVDGEFVFLSEEKADQLSSSNCFPGDLVFTHRGNIGQVGMIPEGKYHRYVVSQSGMKLSVKKDRLDNHFLFYFFKSNIGQHELLQNESQVGVPSISSPLTSLKSVNIRLPPLPEQRAIASVLSSLDDKIDLLHRQNKTLEAMAETLYRQMFIENKHQGWEEGYLQDDFDFTMGLSPPGESYNEVGLGIPLFQGNADFQFRFPTERIYTTDPRRFAEKYDTLISVRAPVGAQNMAREKCCIGRGVAAFIYKKNSQYYTYTYFKLRSLMKEIQTFNDEGTVFGSINKGDFEKIVITIPPSDSIDNFQDQIKPIDDKIILNSDQVRTLEDLRNMLLPKLMSGEMRVKYD